MDSTIILLQIQQGMRQEHDFSNGGFMSVGVQRLGKSILGQIYRANLAKSRVRIHKGFRRQFDTECNQSTAHRLETQLALSLVGSSRRQWVSGISKILIRFGRCAAAMGLVFSPLSACTIIDGQILGGKLVLRFQSKAGATYRIDSTDRLTSTWSIGPEIASTTEVTEWTSPTISDDKQRFHRVQRIDAVLCDAPAHASPALTPSLRNGDAIPREISNSFPTSRELAVNAFYLASQLGGQGLKLLTNGTLSQTAQQWSYSPEPADRLVARLQTGQATDFYLARMEGDFSGNAETFLKNNHFFEWRSSSPGLGDVSFRSVLNGSLLLSAVRGEYVFQGTRYEIDLTATTDQFFDSSFGSLETRTDSQMLGMIRSFGFQLEVGQRDRFEIIVVDGKSDSTSQQWLSHKLHLGTDVFQWVNVKKQKSFKNGIPSQTDTYWDARGTILKNDAPLAVYQKTNPSVGGVLSQIKFNLVIGAESIELESWDVR